MPGNRNWCWTLNNPTGLASALPFSRKDVKYSIWQLEEGENNTSHLQGYTEFHKQMAMSSLKKLHNRIHWEQRQGNRSQARDYCRKRDSRVDGPWEHGTWVENNPGRRTDLEQLKDSVDEGKKPKELWDDHYGPMCRYYKAVEVYREVTCPDRTWKTKVIVYWGPTGTGKSWRASKKAGPDAYWVDAPKDSHQLWWDGYDRHENVVLDEFYGWLPWSFLLRLLDCYPFKVPVKGGTRHWLAKKVYITSNKHPSEWYGEKYKYETLERRLHKVECMEKAYTSVCDEILPAQIDDWDTEDREFLE